MKTLVLPISPRPVMEHPLLLALAALTLVVAAGTLVEMARGGRRTGDLRDVPPLPADDAPLISVVIAARDEAHGIEAALGSVLAQRGPVEVVVVDDRSTDGTGAILDRMAAAAPGLRVVHVARLPDGWLGKCHALQVGADAARGELLCFTDADVVMAPDTLLRAAAYLRREGLDHLTMAPRLDMPGALLQAFGVTFGIFFSLFARPWKARDPRSAHHVGIGAFNLLRADAYRAIGGHAPIRMRPDDDMKLGKLVRRHGLAQDFLFAPAHLSVEWYSSVGEALRGLRKNGFAGVDYRLWVVVLATVVHLAAYVLPFVAVPVTGGWTRALFAAAAALLMVTYAAAARGQGSPVRHALLFPVCVLLFLAALWSSTLLTLARGGIEWRGTRYPLDELRANRV